MTAHGKCSWFEIFESARHFRIEFESGRPIRIRIESRSFAGSYFTRRFVKDTKCFLAEFVLYKCRLGVFILLSSLSRESCGCYRQTRRGLYIGSKMAMSAESPRDWIKAWILTSKTMIPEVGAGMRVKYVGRSIHVRIRNAVRFKLFLQFHKSGNKSL